MGIGRALGHSGVVNLAYSQQRNRCDHVKE